MDGKIYKAISQVMKDVGIVGKNDTNDFDHYKFRGIDAVMNALNPAMIKNGIFVVPTVLESKREERQGKNGTLMMYSIITVKYTFYAEDGSFVESVVVGEAMDRSDKSTNKAMSAAFKYACFQTFCIPTEEMKDSEEESLEIGEKPNQKPTSAPKNRKDTPEEAVKNEEMKASVDPVFLPTPDHKTTKEQWDRFYAEKDRTGITDATILANFGVKQIEDMTQAQVINALNMFKRTPDKKA